MKARGILGILIATVLLGTARVNAQDIASADTSLQVLSPPYLVVADQVGSLAAPLKAPLEDLPRDEDDAPASAYTFSITGQIRHRSEVVGKQVYPGADYVPFHLLRTRIGVAFAPTEDVDVLVQLQDARVFGSEDPTKGRGTLDGSADALDFHQAYFVVGHLFETPLALKVGRQEFAYGNQRLIGSVGWSNVGRTFDAGVVSYRTDKATVDFFTAKLSDSPTSISSQNLHGVYGAFRFEGAPLVDVFVLIDNDTAKLPGGEDAGKSKLVRYTAGAFLRGAFGPMDVELEGAYQTGKTAQADSLARASIGAYLLSGSLAYTLNRKNNLRLGVLYTRLSGDRDPGDATVRTFNTLFATNHKFYGYMDYFPRTYSRYGLQDFALRMGVKAASNVTLHVDLHHFALEQRASWIDPAGNRVEKQVLGQEVDVTAKVKYNTHFSFVTGASLFLADDLMRQVIGKETAFQCYLMTMVTF